MKKNWNGKQVLIIGAARQGLALARYLSSQGARVTLNDSRSADALSDVREKLNDESITWATGGHPLELLERVELVCVSGGVPLDIPLIQEAVKRNLPLTNDSQIFMEVVPCPVIGITGSAGKTTTTALLGEIAHADRQKSGAAWVGGNIGTPLIDQVDRINQDDIVILELSSFQLELMRTSPQIAAVTNITPNHLDRHGTLEAYTAAKAHILLHQSGKDIAVLNREDAGSWALREYVKGELVSFGLQPLPEGAKGSFIANEHVCLQNEGGFHVICHQNDILLQGQHMVLNVLAAAATADAAGFSIQAMQEAIRQFKGVSHRLEMVREHQGIRWINDSIATAPERTIAAILAFREPIVLLLGGKDKNLPWEKLAQLVHQRVDHVVIFGDAAQKIEKALNTGRDQELPFSLFRVEKMTDALEKAREIAEPGDIVLLSPGGTSYDEFKDFEERGERFRLWVQQLP